MSEQTPQPAAPQPQPAAPLTEAEDKQWASFAHFGGILWLLPSLIIWLVFKDRGARTNVEAKEALNWQITFLIFYIGLSIVLWILTAILTAAAFGMLNEGMFAVAGFFGMLSWVLPLLLWIANVILSIMGGVKVNGGGSYRYPVNFRFIK